MRLRLRILGVLALILVSQALLSIDFKDVTDSLRLIIDSKRTKTAEKIQALDKLIEYDYLANEYDDMKSVIENAFEMLEHPDDSCVYLKFALWEAKFASSENDKQKAQILAKKVLQSTRRFQCQELKVSSLLFLAKLNLRSKDSLISQNFIKEAHELAKTINDDLLIARSINMKGITYLINGNFVEARRLILQALETFLALKEKALAGRAFFDIANSYYQKSVYDSAMFYNTKAISLLKESHSLRDLVNSYNYMALFYQNTGRLEEAITMYFKGLKIADKYDYQHDRIIFLYNIGNCYYSLNATNKAIENFKLCLQLAQNDKDTISVIYASNALGYLALDENIGVNIDTADKYISKSYELSKIVNNNYTLIFGATGMASIEINKQNFTKAQDYIDRAYDYASFINNPEDLININTTQAKLYAKQKKYQRAINLLLKTKKQALAINSQESARSVIIELADIYEESGDFRNALLYHKKEKNYQDSINSSSILKNLITIENQYDQEKIEKIKALEQENARIARLAELKRARLTTIIFIISTITLFIISWLLFKLSKNRKKINQSLKEHNRFVENHRDELKDLIEKLKTTTENLEISNKTKSKLLSIIGHDLRNPFNVIKGYIDLLIEDSSDPETRHLYYNRINSASDKLLDMVDNLLVWSRNQTDKIEVRKTEISLKTLLANALYNLQGNANFKEINLTSDYEGKDDILIHADPDMLNRVIHNLIINALKFTPKKGKVSLGYNLNNSKLKVWVKDTGIGMSPENAAAVFLDSSKLINSGTEGEKGTGLGLSICRDFIEAHQGKIWAESEVDRGATFFFEIPLS